MFASSTLSPFTHHEEVDYVGNAPRQQNNPYSNTYNPGWQNHPNFGWSNNTNQGSSGFQRPYSQQPQRPQQFSQFQQPPQQEQKQSTDELMLKYIANTNEYMEKQGATIARMEKRLNQMAMQGN